LQDTTKRGSIIAAVKSGVSSKDSTKGYIELLEQLISVGVDINLKNYRGETALMQAAARGNLEAISFLLEHKANPLIENL
jgi:ankyrin repeat protein